MEVEVFSKENIKPYSPTPNHLKTFNLSILDQVVTFPYIPIILHYPNLNEDINNVFQALERSVLLKIALGKTLTQFYPLAGTIKDHLSIDCNDVGANYVIAMVHGRCDDFLRRPDHGLITRFLPIEPSFDESSAVAPVTNIQVNIFKCGGIAIGLCMSHKILDGAALHTFLKGWANMVCGAEVIYPNLIASSLFPAKNLWLRDISSVYFKSLLRYGKCSTKRFVFGSNAIATLKAEAARNGVHQPTRVEVVSALIWKCALGLSREACGFQNTSLLTHAVNLRRKLAENSSKDFLGNIFWMSKAVCQANYEPTLHGLVNLVRESIAKIDVEFVNNAQGDEGYVAMQKSLEENGEIGSIGPANIYGFTSWCNMGFYDIDFGWGKPSWVTGVAGDGMAVFGNLVTLMDTKCHGGIEAWVNSDEEEMKILQRNQELLAYASLDPSPLSDDEIHT